MANKNIPEVSTLCDMNSFLNIFFSRNTFLHMVSDIGSWYLKQGVQQNWRFLRGVRLMFLFLKGSYYFMKYREYFRWFLMFLNVLPDPWGRLFLCVKLFLFFKACFNHHLWRSFTYADSDLCLSLTLI